MQTDDFSSEDKQWIDKQIGRFEKILAVVPKKNKSLVAILCIHVIFNIVLLVILSPFIFFNNQSAIATFLMVFTSTSIVVILIIILIYLSDIRNKKENKKGTKKESENKELGKILYYLEQLDEFTIIEAENICQKVDELIAKNRIYLSEDFSKDWIKLKHNLYMPEAVNLRENLQNQLRKKLEK